ncbi:MAG TPA: tRNA 2-thiouridine(34) synthase MnmA [Candidatus Limousia pullorum]|uniref:tRNA-specific 2-thiouridylase MnmA n=1 Tax=Candidatus Limousia pullorum TaxID=2840860 RepID=A0A9D1LXA2_9FIRM|nr:tRNA 2-thiouridine(34) synthase MnmA [Candidatus Limousia pullorum]
MKKIITAMSGGVDSSAAALILQNEGYTVAGGTLRLFDRPESGQCGKKCGSLKDISDAKSVCEKLGIEHYVFDYRDNFKKEVIDRFCDGYIKGETPNPCLECNRYIKFKGMIEQGEKLGFEGTATGHYVRREYDQGSGRYLLRKASDVTKDQTYVLYSLSQEILSRTLFPLGDLSKVEIRKLAEDYGLVNAKKAESQDICFVPDGDYASFLKRETGYVPKLGDFVLEDGTFVAKNKGIIHYTIGQRKGLGIAWEHPLYVISKNPQDNCVVLGKNEDLFSKRLEAYDVNFIAINELKAPMRVVAKTRYSQKEAQAVVYPLEKDRVIVEFSEPQRAVTPGQAVVFYKDDYLVGGGKILSAKE